MLKINLEGYQDPNVKDTYKILNKFVCRIKLDANDENISSFLKLFILLYADDTVLFSTSRQELQATLNVFASNCEKWKLTVNVQKTKVIIFSGEK